MLFLVQGFARQRRFEAAQPTRRGRDTLIVKHPQAFGTALHQVAKLNATDGAPIRHNPER
jgi:hypothetical protein